MLLPLALALVTRGGADRRHRARWCGARAQAPERLDFDRAVYRDQLDELERDRARGADRRARGADGAARDRAPPARRRPRRCRPAAPGAAHPVARGGAGAGRGGRRGRGSICGSARPACPTCPSPSAPRSAPPRPTRPPISPRARPMRGAGRQARRSPTMSRAGSPSAAPRRRCATGRRAPMPMTHALALAPGRADIAAAYGEVLVLGADGIVTPAARDAFAQGAGAGPAERRRALLPGAGRRAGGAHRCRRSRPGRSSPPRRPRARPSAPPCSSASPMRRRAPASPCRRWRRPPRRRQHRQPGRGGLRLAIGRARRRARRSAGAERGADRGGGQHDARAARPDGARAWWSSLAAELQAKPDDLDGWLRLARAYGVLDERDKAADAYRARRGARAQERADPAERGRCAARERGARGAALRPRRDAAPPGRGLVAATSPRRCGISASPRPRRRRPTRPPAIGSASSPRSRPTRPSARR